MKREINRRDFFKKTAQLTALGLLGRSAFADTLPELKPARVRKKKKGFGSGTKKDADWRKKLTDLQANWFYTWGPELPENTPAGIEFVPMMWGRYTVGNPELNEQLIKLYRDGTISALMGFNEPEEKKQSNIPLEDALDLWPQLMELGIPLGSPGCVHPDREWMIAFMKGVEERELRVDFVCVHSYGGPNAQALVNRLKKVHEMYGKPIWITEFAVGDWKAETVDVNQHRPERIAQFMAEVLPMLDETEFVHRYAWFSAKPSSPPLGTSALFDDAGNLTPLGELYSSL